MLFVSKGNPGPVAIRFLEQGLDVHSYYVHEYKVPDSGVQGGFRTKRFTCSKQDPWNSDCGGCNAGMKRKLRGVFDVIQRQRPVLRRGADGRAMKDNNQQYIVDGYRDEVVIASVGSPTASMLRKADGQYHGLMSRDFIVMYSGDTFQAWNLSPSVDGSGNAMATPMSEADVQLAATKHDLDEFMKPPTPQEAAQIIARYGGNSGAQPAMAAPGVQQQPQNPMLAGVTVPAGTPVNALGQATGQQPTQPAPPQPAPATVPASTQQ